MKKIIACVLLTLALPAHAVICKTVDSDGVVAYANVPASECKNKIKLPPVSRYKPRALPNSASNPNIPVGPASVVTKEYSSMAIVVPVHNTTIRNEDGQVLVSVKLEPALQEGNKLKILIDGVAIQPLFSGTLASLSGISRGLHVITAEIVDEAGSVKKRAKAVSFTLRQPSLNDRLRKKSESTPTVPVTLPVLSRAPAGTNPAFAPKFTP